MVEKVISGTSGPSIPTSSVDSQVEAPSQDIVSSPDTNPTRRKRRSFSIPGRLLSRAMLPIMAALSMAGGSAVSAQLQPNYLKPNQASSSQLKDNNIMPSEQAPKVEIRTITNFDPISFQPVNDSSVGIIGTENEYHVTIGESNSTGEYSMQTLWQVPFEGKNIAVSPNNPNVQLVTGHSLTDRWTGKIVYTLNSGQELKTKDINRSMLNQAQITPDSKKAYIPKSPSDTVNGSAPAMLFLDFATNTIREFPIEGLGDWDGIWSMSKLRAMPDGSFEAEALAGGFGKLINLKLTSEKAVARILDSSRYLIRQISEGIDPQGRRMILATEEYIWTSGEAQGSRGRLIGYFFDNNGAIVDTRVYTPDLAQLAHRGDPYPYVSSIRNGTIAMGLDVVAGNSNVYPEIQETAVDNPSQIRVVPTSLGEWPAVGNDRTMNYIQQRPNSSTLVSMRGADSGAYINVNGTWKKLEVKVVKNTGVNPTAFKFYLPVAPSGFNP